jgi:hypothetical protein
MRQKTLDENHKCVEEMKISRKASSCVIGKVSNMEREKGLTCA